MSPKSIRLLSILILAVLVLAIGGWLAKGAKVLVA
jgi:hypothetical protein